tara:strand:- start:20106 stop:21086 length:981 start_codon:yes stop_codon:yes gene_type:complete
MTGWGSRLTTFGAARQAHAGGGSLMKTHSGIDGLAAASGQSGTGGWHWAFRIRPTDGASDGVTGEQKAEHPTRRSRKLARLEAVLLVADGALSFRKLAQFATLADAAEARELVQELNDKLDRGGTAFRIEKVATGVRMMTRPQFSMWLDRLHNRQARAKLSPPMLETLSIVAYRQPVTRADVDKIRGVQASEMLRQLMDRGLIRITGEDDSLGRPYLYGTTKQFLEEYGFGSLDDLPMADTLRRRDEPEEVDEPESDVEEESFQLLADDEADEEIEDDSDETAEYFTADSDPDADLDDEDESDDEEWDEGEDDDGEVDEDDAEEAA